MKNNRINIVLSMVLAMITLGSCTKYLDIVPDNVATIDNAFTRRSEAEKYLFTCYSFLPNDGDPSGNPAFSAGDEWSMIWPTVDFALDPPAYHIARGLQNIVNPFMNFWDGSNGGSPLFIAIRDCNIFLDNIDRVPDMAPEEKRRWIGEAKVLKAYYMFYLLRMYGPIPLIKTNLPVGAAINEVKVYRQPVDSCFDYIVSLLDEGEDDLPDIIDNKADELGRLTRPIALSLKAEVMVTAASPLFNGNGNYSNFRDGRGVQLFNPDFDKAKWDSAVVACREAVDLCHQVGMHLYYYEQNISQYNLSAATKTKLNIRGGLSEKWNSGMIWANTNSMVNLLQSRALPRGLDPTTTAQPRGQIAAPLKIASQFYTKNGLPINEDKTWDYANRFSLRTATDAEKYDIEQGYTTAYLNFDREPRFYADLGFDGGTWYGQGKFDDNSQYVLQAKKGQAASQQVQFAYSTTGYWVKKYVNYQSVISVDRITIEAYPWPEMRLADLYLLYAEALNESEGPGQECLSFLNLVRSRAGIPTVEDSWTNFSKDPGKYKSQQGLREIIHQERLNELAFEGDRYWDLRRWKEAIQVMNAPIEGWDIEQAAAKAYYRPRVIFNQTFGLKDYFWPIEDHDITVNRELIQNPGW